MLLMKFFKKAERTFGKIVLPKYCIEKFGYEYFLEVYEDYIKLVPANKNNSK